MTDDLVKRLREPISQMSGTDDDWIARVVEEREQAADRIEALEEEVRTQRVLSVACHEAMQERIEELERLYFGALSDGERVYGDMVEYRGMVDTARREALEEAARVARGYSASDVHSPVDEVSYGLGRAHAAAAIRALKEEE